MPSTVDTQVVQNLIETVTQANTNTNCDDEEECVAPKLVLYFIWAQCLTINNGACPDWTFCTPTVNAPD